MISCSLDSTKELRKLILENPDLPLLVFCGEESWGGDWPYELAEVNSCSILEYGVIENQWVERDDYEEELSNTMRSDPEYCDLPEDEFDSALEERLANAEFVKAITIKVG